MLPTVPNSYPRFATLSVLRHRSSSERHLSSGQSKIKKNNGYADVPSPQRSSSFARFCIFSSALVSVLVLTYRGYTNVPLISDAYALCSRDGEMIYTVDNNNTRTQCMVVDGPNVVDTGNLEEVKAHWKNLHNIHKTPLMIRYLKTGSIVVPGMSDSHGHTLEYGASVLMPLESAKRKEDAVACVRNYILSHPDVYNDTSIVIEGWGWDHTSWPVQEWPSAADLDGDYVIRGRSVILQSKDGHALWVSGKALELSQPFPNVIDGGLVIRDAFGNPTGVVIDNAQDHIKKPVLTEETLLKRFKATVRDAFAVGLTSIHDAGFSPVSLEFFKRQAELGNFPIRVYGMTYFDENGEYWGNLTTPSIAAGNGRFTARSVKLFADGALRSGGAALYEPYADNPETTGLMRLSTDVLNQIIPQFLRDGWQVNVHAIGDRANAIVLDAFEAALKDVDVIALRPRLEHAQIMTKADMMRVGKLGVIASIQPTHVISDMWYAEERLGPERVKGLFAYRSLVDSGARITLGSDFPVESLNPLSGFYAAITRVSITGQSPHGPGGWFPEQCLTRQEALRGMTIDPAYASFTEDTLGSIVPGNRADFVILSQDIMSIPTNKILETNVIATVIDGMAVYGKV